MTNDDQEKRDQIWKFVLEHEEYFCDPPPRGPGVPTAGDDTRPLPQKAGGMGAGQDPCPETETGTPTPGRETPTAPCRPAWRQEHGCCWTTSGGWPGRAATPSEISAQLDVTEAGVRNVLALGQGAYDGDAQGPIHLPEIAAFRKNWGRCWPGGQVNGNGHRKSESPI